MKKNVLIQLITFTIIFLSCQKETPIPNAPSSLGGEVISDTEINLNWADNSNNETGFKIQRKSATGIFTDIATLDANTTRYTDKGLVPKTNYQYRVYAFNSTETPTQFTNEVDLKTLILVWDTVFTNQTMNFGRNGIVVNGTTAFIGANTPTSAMIIKTTDAGKTWSVIDTKIPTLQIRSIAFQSESVGYVSLFAKGVYRTVDGGANWTKIKDCTCGLTADANSMSILDQLTTYYSTDKGVTFTQKSATFTTFQNPVSSFRFNNNVYAYFVEGIAKSTDGGINWSSAIQQLSPLYSITPINENKWYANVGTTGLLYKTENAGGNWSLLPGNVEANMFMAAKNDTLFLNKNGYVYWTIDGTTLNIDHDKPLQSNLLSIGNKLIGFNNGIVVKRRY